jgi:phage-related protein
MDEKYQTFITSTTKEFINSLPEKAGAKIKSTMIFMGPGNFKDLFIKTLRSPIKELRIGKYRIIFFVKGNTIYFIGGFLKKTSKTPKQEINNAIKTYKVLIK